MEQYPSIQGSAKAPLGKPCIAFVKYDGSNLRFEWNPKQGWHKYGTRRHLFDVSDPVFGKAIQLFDPMADEIVRRVKERVRNPQRITAFAEFFGPGSFAGSHIEGETQELRLFDIFLFKQGLLPPKDFVKLFGDLPQAAEIVYEGNLNQQFVNGVRKGEYPVFEGVIAKGSDFMVKIKTDEYFRKLRHKYPERWEQFAE